MVSLYIHENAAFSHVQNRSRHRHLPVRRRRHLPPRAPLAAIFQVCVIFCFFIISIYKWKVYLVSDY